MQLLSLLKYYTWPKSLFLFLHHSYATKCDACFYVLGLENLYHLTYRRTELRVDMQDFSAIGSSAFAQYFSFEVDSEAYGYMLHVDRFQDGGAGVFDTTRDVFPTINCYHSKFNLRRIQNAPKRVLFV